MLERVQRRATKIIPNSYKMRFRGCGLTRPDQTYRPGDQIEVYNILNGYKNIDRNICSQLKKRE